MDIKKEQLHFNMKYFIGKQDFKLSKQNKNRQNGMKRFQSKINKLYNIKKKLNHWNLEQIQ